MEAKKWQRKLSRTAFESRIKRVWTKHETNILSAIGIATLSFVGTSLSNCLDRQSLQYRLTTGSMQLNRVSECAEALKVLGTQPPQLMENFKETLVAQCGEIPPLYSEPNALNAVLAGSAASRTATARAEGITEHAGDIVVQLLAGIGATEGQSQEVDISVVYSVNVTNHIDDENTIDATLTVEGEDLNATTIVKGKLTEANRVLFSDVTIPAIPRGKLRLIRISNVRLNITQYSKLEESKSFSLQPSYDALAIVTIDPKNQNRPVYLANNRVAVAKPILGVIAEVRSGDSRRVALAETFSELRDRSKKLKSGLRSSFQIYLQEGFEGASRRRDEGGSEAGVRFLARFFNVPQGVDVYVSTKSVGDASQFQPKAIVVSGSDPNGAGGTILEDAETSDLKTATGVPLKKVEISDGFGFVAWELISDGGQRGKSTVVFDAVVTAQPGGKLEPGSMQVSASLGPVSTIATASSTAPVPRFLDLTIDPTTVYTLSRD